MATTPPEMIPLVASQLAPASYQTTGKPVTELPRTPDMRRKLSQLKDDDDDDDSQEHKTTVWQTFIHLTKGYIGCGVLSLPWAVSQLGVPLGCTMIVLMSCWSSYNCWTVVKLKRFIERKNVSVGNYVPQTSAIDDAASDTPSNVSNNTNITYPDVGEWAYGRQFNSYVTACVCIQQLAICTVFLSFIGENILAVLERMEVHMLSTHAGVLTLALPVVLSLSYLPNLKSLSPVMAAGSITLMVGFGVLGYVIVKFWDERPETTPTINVSQAPLAVCAILYSYEGICLILPVESAMKDPQHFKPVFVASMATVALILALVSSLSVMAFGEVTNGSITAFLVKEFSDNENISLWLMISNTAVSLSVLLTYPLQLFPALELISPWVQSKFPPKTDAADEDDLDAFEPLPPLPEHEVASIGSHEYDNFEFDVDEAEPAKNGDNKDEDDTSRAGMSSVTSMFPEMTTPGDSPMLRTALVISTYLVAVVVPNVQALISLAGALAGSSTALLIPPILELAFIKHLETDASQEEVARVDERRWRLLTSTRDKWLFEKVKSYILLALGFVFCVFGTYASLADIVRIYLGK
jgi:amino acid permease